MHNGFVLQWSTYFTPKQHVFFILLNFCINLLLCSGKSQSLAPCVTAHHSFGYLLHFKCYWNFCISGHLVVCKWMAHCQTVSLCCWLSRCMCITSHLMRKLKDVLGRFMSVKYFYLFLKTNILRISVAQWSKCTSNILA